MSPHSALVPADDATAPRYGEFPHLFWDLAPERLVDLADDVILARLLEFGRIPDLRRTNALRGAAPRLAALVIPEHIRRFWQKVFAESPQLSSVKKAYGPRARTRRHDWIDERSRALGDAVGRRLQEDPTLVRVALAQIGQWEAAVRQRGDARIGPALGEWRQILERASLADIVALLREDSTRAARLRQSSPFVGVLTEDERATIFRRFEEL